MSDIKIKGTSIRDLETFVKEQFSDKYDLWKQTLSDDSKDLYKNVILNTNFYDIANGYTEPIKVLSNICYEGDLNKCAWEVGCFESKKSLGGIYSIFLKIPSLDFIIDKSTSIATTYYIGIKVKVTKTKIGSFLIEINGFNKDEELMIPNISGWINHLGDIISKKPHNLDYKIEDLDNGKVLGKIEIKFEK